MATVHEDQQPLQVCTEGLKEDPSPQFPINQPRSPSCSPPQPDWLLEHLFGRMLCCSSQTNQVQSELAEVNRLRYFSSTPIFIDDERLYRKKLHHSSGSPYDMALKKEIPFRTRPGSFWEGMDDLRVTHPVSPVISARKTYDSSDTITTAMSSTGEDELERNSMIWGGAEEEEDEESCLSFY